MKVPLEIGNWMLVEEVKLLWESVHSDIKDLHEIVTMQQKDLIKLEESVVISQKEIKGCITEEITSNKKNIQQLIEENKYLHKENIALKDRVSKIELLQLENNVIISGQLEKPWENYETTKECIIDTIASTISPTVDSQVRQEASKVEISCCSRVGRYKLGWPWPISVTFHKKQDKQKLIISKCNLPNGIFVNEEFPLHIKRKRDILRPILRLAKSLPEYHTKCKLENDCLIINGMIYIDYHQN